MICFSLPFGFYRGNCFDRVVALLIPAFVSVNVQFDLVVRDKLSSPEILFLSFPAFFFVGWYINVGGCVHLCVLKILFIFCFSSLLLFFPEIIYWYAIKFNRLLIFFPEWLCVCVCVRVCVCVCDVFFRYYSSLSK